MARRRPRAVGRPFDIDWVSRFVLFTMISWPLCCFLHCTWDFLDLSGRKGFLCVRIIMLWRKLVTLKRIQSRPGNSLVASPKLDASIINTKKKSVGRTQADEQQQHVFNSTIVTRQLTK